MNEAVCTELEVDRRFRCDIPDGASYWITWDPYESEDRRWIVQNGEQLYSATVVSLHPTLAEAQAWVREQ